MRFRMTAYHMVLIQRTELLRCRREIVSNECGSLTIFGFYPARRHKKPAGETVFFQQRCDGLKMVAGAVVEREYQPRFIMGPGSASQKIPQRLFIYVDKT